MSQPHSEQPLRIIAADLGFGGLKVATIEEGQIKVAVVPSVVGVGETDLGMLSAGLGRKRQAKPLTVTFEGDTAYLVGPNVHRYTRPIERLDFLRLSEGPELRALLYAALWQALGSGSHQVDLMIGLPVEVVQDRAQARGTLRQLRRWLLGGHSFNVDGEAVALNIIQVNAAAQPLGTYFAWGANINGYWRLSKQARTAPVAICDIGFNTLDLFVVEGGVVGKRGTGGDTLGMHRVADTVIRQVRQQYDVPLSLHQADELVRLYVNGGVPLLYHHRGEDDLSQMIEQALGEGFAGVNQFIRRHWDRGTQFRHLLITGGGAQAYREQVLAHYPFATVLPNAVTANAEGIAKLAYRKHLAGRRK
jgi:hypothetical protein